MSYEVTLRERKSALEVQLKHPLSVNESVGRNLARLQFSPSRLALEAVMIVVAAAVATSVFAQGTMVTPVFSKAMTRTIVPSTVTTATTEGTGAFTGSVNALIGSTRSFNNSPVPNARLRLRSITNGRIEAQLTADAEGRFAFRAIEPGTYVVEMTEVVTGAVVATSQAVTVASNEIMQTIIRLPGRLRSFGWWAGSSASSAVSAASGVGVLAVDDIARPASPER